MKLRDLGEVALINHVQEGCLIRPNGVIQGIGDDCAVLAFSDYQYLLVTMDMLIEGVHFRRELVRFHELGWKTLAVNLSDIAAMGGTPRDAFISLALPSDVDLEDIDGFYGGFRELASKYQVNLLGGDTSSSPHGIMVALTVTGTVAPDKILFRKGAHAGDVVVVTGCLGDSAAGLALLTSGTHVSDSIRTPLVKAHLLPEPHIEEALFLASLDGVHAAIDISDGLSVDLAHLCTASGVGATIDAEALPISSETQAVADALGVPSTAWALHGGADYVLLLAIASDCFATARQRYEARFGKPLYCIGEFSPYPEVRLKSAHGREMALEPKGYDHFTRGAAAGSVTHRGYDT